MNPNRRCFSAASALLLLCATSISPAQADSAQEIHAAYSQLDAAYSQRDSTAIAAFLAPNFARRDWDSVLTAAQYQAELKGDFDGTTTVKTVTKIQRLIVTGDKANVLVARRVDLTFPKPLPMLPPPYFTVKVTEEQWTRSHGRWQLKAMSDTPLYETLCVLNERDQGVRRRLIADPKNKTLAAEVGQTDTANRLRLKQIIRQYGWPGFDLAGTDGESMAFVIVQHADSDPAFQKKTLPLIEAAVKRGQAMPCDAAYLTDRILCGEHKPQIYGTQRNIPIVDPAHVDERRAAAGLEPLAVYQAQLEQIYQPMKRSSK